MISGRARMEETIRLRFDAQAYKVDFFNDIETRADEKVRLFPVLKSYLRWRRDERLCEVARLPLSRVRN